MEDSVFTKIVKGELPSHKIYEDDKIIAILNINPAHEGHTLVIPKAQVDQYIDLPDEDYLALWPVVKKISARLRDVMGKDRVGIIVEGVDVPHTHIHLIPFNKDESLKADGGQGNEPDHEALADVAKKLSF